MAWGGTPVRMSIVGSDLALDEGADAGSYEATAVSIGSDPEWVYAICHFDWEQSPANGPGGVTDVALFWRTSENGVLWGDWEPFQPQEIYLKEFQFRVEVSAVPGIGYLPRITQLNGIATYARGQGRQPSVKSATTLTPPGAPGMGDRYLIDGVGLAAWAGYDDYLVECADDYAASLLWIFTPPVEGMVVYVDAAGKDYTYRSGSWAAVEAGIPEPTPLMVDDLIQYTATGWDAVGAVGGDPVLGDINFTGISTGSLNNTSIINPLVPSTGDVLTWDGSDWDAIAPSVPSTYYTVLDATATTAELNAALVASEVVYLKPGNYAAVTGKVTIPSNKQLIGLSGGGSQGSSANAPQIGLVTAAGVYVDMGINSRVEGIRFELKAGSANDMIKTSSTYDIVVTRCDFYAANVPYYAINASFKEISHVTVKGCYGIKDASSGTWGGKSNIRYFRWEGDQSNTTSSNRGIDISIGGSSMTIDNVHLQNGAYGIFASGVNPNNGLQLSNIYCSNINDYSASCALYLGKCYRMSASGINVYNSGGTAKGVYMAQCDYSSVSGVNVSGCTSGGIDFDQCRYFAVSALYAYGCGGRGIYLNHFDYGTAASIGSYNSGADGIYMRDCEHSSISTVVSYSSGTDGVYMMNCNYLTLADVTTNNNTGDGIQVDNNRNGIVINGGIATGNAVGLNLGWGAGAVNNKITSFQSSGNTGGDTIGANWDVDLSGDHDDLTNVTSDQHHTEDHGPRHFDGGSDELNVAALGAGTETNTSKRLAPDGSGGLQWLAAAGITDPATKATNDILQYNGASWDAVGAVTGDRVQGILYTEEIDISDGAVATRLLGDSISLPDLGATPPVGRDEGDFWYQDDTINVRRSITDVALAPAIGDLSYDTGTGASVVQGIRGYSVQAGAPTAGDILVFTTAWQHYDGLEDWVRVYDSAVSAVSTVAISGVTQASRILRFILQGRITTTGGNESYVTLEPGGVTANQKSIEHIFGLNGGTIHGAYQSAGTPGSRMALGRTYGALTNGHISVDSHFLCETGRGMRHTQSRAQWHENAAPAAGVDFLTSEIAGIWNDTTTTFTSVTLRFQSTSGAAVTFTGRVIAFEYKRT